MSRKLNMTGIRC